jgi:hypothetical protein
MSDASIIKELSNLGRLDKNFKDKDLLLRLSTSPNKNIRFLSISNLAKLNDIKLLNVCFSIKCKLNKKGDIIMI